MSNDHPAKTPKIVHRFFGSAAVLRPRRWGIATRSAVASGCVVLVAMLVIGAALVVVLYESLLSSVDDAAAGRVRDIVAALNKESPKELDDALLDTDQRIFAVQVIDANGKIVRRSASAPEKSLLPRTFFDDSLRTGIPDDLSPNDDMRMAGQTATGDEGTHTVIVGAGSEGAEGSAQSVALLLTSAAPVIAAVAAVATYRLVKRSLRSVEAIRARVAEISTSALGERVPVPPQRDEISALASTMNEMLARVEAGHTAQRRFVGDASHELRSPLASIISALEVAQDYPQVLDDDLRSGALIPEAHRMQALVEDLLLLARVDEGQVISRRDDVDLQDLAEGEVARIRRRAHLDVKLRAEPVLVVGHLTSLGRVLRNLVDNAVRHTTSTVELTVERRGAEIALVVADDGPGIPVEHREYVFGRFVRLDSARSREGGGSGLGLAIVAEIVAAHRGTVEIDDRPGGGARVTVLLPSAPTPAQPRDGQRGA